MSADETGPPVRRPRQIEFVELSPGPARELRDAVYELYLRADSPTLDDLVNQIAADDDLPGAPKRDVIGRIIGGREVPAKQQDAVSVVVALARDAGRDPAVAADRVRDLWVAAKMAPPWGAMPTRLGIPVTECSPSALEVHRAIDVADHGVPLSELPCYIPRAHDGRLAKVIDAVAGEASRMATLVGGSSTGKTRACWEAIRPLGTSGRWRVWHPISPSRSDAAAEAIGEVGPYTVVWLNEAQHYLITTDPATGERISAGLRELLHAPDRGPVLVLATLWPQFWDELTSRPAAGQPDPHAQARELLEGTDIQVPNTFAATDLMALRNAAGDDPRLRHAAEHADAGRITQHLAGAPELLRRYRNAPPAARAVIDVAIDARRLGHPLAIPHTLLEQAAPGYLNDHDWERAGDEWFTQALAYTAKPSKGVPGPVTRIRPRPGDPPSLDAQPTYRLADYLEQTGRTERAGVFPPAAFWNAAASTIADPDLLQTLGHEATRRGRYRRAVQMHRQAAGHGNTDALRYLARLRKQAGDQARAEALYRQAADHGNTDALRDLAELREEAGDRAGAEVLYRRAADCGDTAALWDLARLRERAGDQAGAEALYRRAADRGDTAALQYLAGLRERADDQAGAESVYRRAADRGNTDALWHLAGLREWAGDQAGAETVYREAADRGNTDALWDLTRLRERAGDQAGAEALAVQAVDCGHTGVLWDLAKLRLRAGDQAGAEALYRRAADRGDTEALRDLAMLREWAGDRARAEALAVQAVDRGNIEALRDLAVLRLRAGDQAGAEARYWQAVDRGDTDALRDLARLREWAGDQAGAEAVYQQAADRGDTDAMWNLARLRERAGDQAGAEVLAVQAVDRGNTEALRSLAKLREWAGDQGGAEALYRQDADRGNTEALWHLAELWKRAGDQSGADSLRRFGLADDGSTAHSLD
ncbi:tetratricopeptide repeat protein [Plantactinospora sp. CA-290183]|uniref:tetratricopeptide repeat protein n=1 Tax=Plantactinospora sp. CA-290183 TaxID=3240006 RepID=UPI003D8E4911